MWDKEYWQRALVASISTVVGATVAIKAEEVIGNNYIVALFSAILTVATAVLIDRLTTRNNQTVFVEPPAMFVELFGFALIVSSILITYFSGFAETDGISYLLKNEGISPSLVNKDDAFDNGSAAPAVWSFYSYSWQDWYLSLMYFGFFLGSLSAFWSWFFRPLFGNLVWKNYILLGAEVFFALQLNSLMMLMVSTLLK